MDFVVSCIHHSSSALSLWSRLAESHVASSQLLLEYLDQHWTTVGGILDSATLATALLHAVNVITVDEHRQLCQVRKYEGKIYIFMQTMYNEFKIA